MVSNKKAWLVVMTLIGIILLVMVGTVSYADGESITGMKFEIEGDRALIQWNGIKNISGYEIHVDKNDGEGYKLLGETAVNRVYINGFSAGQKCNIKVRAFVSVQGKKTYVTDFSEAIVVERPAMDIEEVIDLKKVENVKAKIDQDKRTAEITWDKVDKATGYEVWVNADEQGYVFLGNCVDNKIGIINFTRGVSYAIKIRAYMRVSGDKKYAQDYSDEYKIVVEQKELDMGGKEDSNNSVGETKPKLATPTGLSYKANTDGQFTFEWDKVDGADGYQVCWILPSGKVALINLEGNKNTSTTVYGFDDEKATYTVKVRAYKINDYGYRDYSLYTKDMSFNGKSKEVKPNEDENEIAKPAKVTDITVNVGAHYSGMSSRSITISWKEVPKATYYNIDIFINGQETPYLEKDHQTTNKAYTFLNESDTTYKVIVTAVTLDSVGNPIEGEPSDPKEFKVEISSQDSSKQKLDTVTGLTVEMDKGSATFKWNKVDGANEYEIELDIRGLGTENRKTSDNKITITGFSDPSGYSAKVRALDTTGKKQPGDYSNEVKFGYEDNSSNNNSNTGNNNTGNSNTGNSSTGNNSTGNSNTGNNSTGNNNTGNNNSGGSGSTTKPSTPTVTPPADVTGLKVKLLGSSANLSWNAVNGAEGYRVEWYNMGQAKTIKTQQFKENIGVITNLEENKQYHIEIRAYKSVNGNMVYSKNPDIITFTTLAKPKILNAQIVDGYIKIDFANDNIGMNNEKGYAIEIYQGSIRNTPIYKEERRTNEYSITITKLQIKPNENYYIRVKRYTNTYSVAAYSTYSNEVPTVRLVINISKVKNVWKVFNTVSWGLPDVQVVGVTGTLPLTYRYMCYDKSNKLIASGETNHTYIDFELDKIRDAKNIKQIKITPYLTYRGNKVYGEEFVFTLF